METWADWIVQLSLVLIGGMVSASGFIVYCAILAVGSRLVFFRRGTISKANFFPNSFPYILASLRRPSHLSPIVLIVFKQDFEVASRHLLPIYWWHTVFFMDLYDFELTNFRNDTFFIFWDTKSKFGISCFEFFICFLTKNKQWTQSRNFIDAK